MHARAFGKAVFVKQSAVNRLNTLGVGADGAIAGVTFATQGAATGTAPAVEINTITSAYRGGGVDGATSATIGNLNGAVSGAVNPIIGAGGSLMPTPGSFTTVALLNQAGGTAQRGAGDVGIASVTQTQTTSMNTVSATGASLAFGPAGFGQVTGVVAPATPIDPAGTGGVNYAGALLAAPDHARQLAPPRSHRMLAAVSPREYRQMPMQGPMPCIPTQRSPPRARAMPRAGSARLRARERPGCAWH